MKIAKIALGLMLCASLSNGYANVNEKIEATSEDTYFYTVYGDGYELGFYADIQALLNQPYKIEIPPEDNFAGCTVAVEPAPIGPAGHYANIRINIDTSVEGDTGGCLVFVKDQNNLTHAIIKYDYTTDY